MEYESFNEFKSPKSIFEKVVLLLPISYFEFKYSASVFSSFLNFASKMKSTMSYPFMIRVLVARTVSLLIETKVFITV